MDDENTNEISYEPDPCIIQGCFDNAMFCSIECARDHAQELDYKELLKTYMEYVNAQEGITYLEPHLLNVHPFADEQLAVLKEMHEEVTK